MNINNLLIVLNLFFYGYFVCGEPIRILSMDGGGIRGVMTASLVQGIEEASGKRAHQLFDIIAGASTGGIIALGLTTPQGDNNDSVMSAEQIKQFYISKGPIIFEARGFFATGPTYDANNMIKVMKEIVGEKLFKNTLKTVLITAFDIDRRRGYSLESDLSEFDILKLVDVARATSAAPTYFSPMPIRFKGKSGILETHFMVDGGLYKNNPSLLALLKAKNKFGNDEIKRRGLILISIGTGQFTGPLNLGTFGTSVKKLVNVAMDVSSNEDNATLLNLMGETPNARYIRVNPRLDNLRDSKIEKLDEASSSNIQRLLEAANAAKKIEPYNSVIKLFQK